MIIKQLIFRIHFNETLISCTKSHQDIAMPKPKQSASLGYVIKIKMGCPACLLFTKWTCDLVAHKKLKMHKMTLKVTRCPRSILYGFYNSHNHQYLQQRNQNIYN